MEKELIYIADPMCSWCWGFSPVVDKLSEQVRGKADLRVLPGGLQMGTRVPLSESSAKEIMHHWQEVTQKTGQPFDFSQPLDTSFVYDTEPSCRALSVMARMKPGCVLDYLKSLQQAFYVGRRDLKDAQVLSEYAQSYGISAKDFLAELEASSALEALNDDIRFVRQCGIEGYPSVLLRSGQRIQRLTIGYQPFEAVQPHVRDWIVAE